VRRHLFTAFGERFTIDVRGAGDMEIDGDLLGHEFTIRRDGQVGPFSPGTPWPGRARGGCARAPLTRPLVTADQTELVTRSRLQTRRSEIPPWKAMYSGCTRSRPHFSLYASCLAAG
jgi:hypothetical protein